MSREIKFRAYHTKRKEWCFGYEKLGGFSLFGEVTIGGGFDVPILELKHLDIMQSTGLKDKNGVEIYEGDIIRSSHFIDCDGEQQFLHHIIKWSEKYNAHFALNIDTMSERDGSTLFFSYLSNALDISVVGNIYENPELLECKR